MSVDKSWLINPNRRSNEYQEGLKSFIERGKEHVDCRGYVRCACATCQNTLIIPFRQMKSHMNAYGICRTYTEWTHHGESLIPAVVVTKDPIDDLFEDLRFMERLYQVMGKKKTSKKMTRRRGKNDVFV